MVDSIIFLAALLSNDVAYPSNLDKVNANRTDVTFCRSITFKLVDKKLASFAQVELKSNGSSKYSLTDSDGKITIDSPESEFNNPYVTIDFPGYERRSASWLELCANPRLAVLKPAQNEAIEEIRVNARRISTDFAPTVINQLSIFTNPAARADPILAVTGLPFATNSNQSADISLRGARATISRAYFNDIPIYEITRGSDVDAFTRSGSILNPSIVRELEVHPSSPPSFLAGSAGGAIRLLPGESGDSGGSFFLSSVGSGLRFDTSDAIVEGSFSQVFATYSNLDLSLEINPAVRSTVDQFENVSLGTFNWIPISDNQNLQIFLQFDDERSQFPLEIFAFDGSLNNQRTRGYGFVTYEWSSPYLRVKIDNALTLSRSEEVLGVNQAENENRYFFSSIDVSTQLTNSIDFRAGIDLEDISLNSMGVSSLSGFTFDLPEIAEEFVEDQEFRELVAYSFLNWSVSSRVSTFAGSRIVISGNQDREFGLQGGISYRSKNKKHQYILSAGRYFVSALPRSASSQPIERVINKQVSIDYKFDSRKVDFSASIYYTEEETAELATRTWGLELSILAQITDKLSFNVSASTLDQKTSFLGSDFFPGENDLDYIIRANLQYAIGNSTTLNIFYNGRQGARFTDIIGGTQTEIPTILAPVFSDEVNGSRFSEFGTLDISVTTSASFIPERYRPLIFVAVTNVLNSDNVRSLATNEDFSVFNEVEGQRRALTIGFVWQF